MEISSRPNHSNFFLNRRHVAILLLFLFAALFLLYRYIFDIDAIGYITVARHYTAGEWFSAINGYWSPLNSWLMVPLLKLGFNDILCFKIANIFFAIGALYQADKLLKKFSFTPQHHIWILLTIMVMVLYYACVQLAADMLFVWIFLWYVNVVLKINFEASTKANLLAGLIAVIAFFAKTYGGVFFIIHFSFLHIIWFPFIQKKGFHFKNYMLGLIAFFPLFFAWMLLLWNKYKMITFGYSGKLNWSWVLKNGQPDYTAFFYQPPYNGATSRWTDPFYSQAETYSPFQSKELMLREIKLIGFNLKNGVIAALWISFAAPVLLFWIWVKRKVDNVLHFLVYIILLFPAVYLLIFIEERYLWPVSVLLLVSACVALKQSVFAKRWMWIMLLFSFVIGPVIRLAMAANNDKEAHQLADIIRQQNLHGPFTAIDYGEYMHKASFITGKTFLGIANAPKNWEQLEAECKAAGIQAVCIQMLTDAEAVAFTNTHFFKKYRNNSVQLAGNNIWLIIVK